MYGRLVATYGLREALALMASSRSPVLGWLRRNGRYLTPAGSRDTGIAVVTYLRSWLAIHTEFMFACILLALLVVAPHLWQHTFQTLDVTGTTKPAEIAEGRATVVIPHDAVPSFTAKHNKIVWRLLVQGEIPNWPDIEDEFVLDVVAHRRVRRKEAA